MNRLLIPFFLVLTGCAGARSSIVMTDSTYPVSLSNGMRGPDGHLLDKSEMEVVGKLHDDRTAWGMFYSLIPLTPRLDLSKEVNGQVGAARGQAVVRLRTETRPCALDYFVILSFLPIWPGCANVNVDGDIIRYRSSEPAPVPTPSIEVQPAKAESKGVGAPSEKACRSRLDCKAGLVCAQARCVEPSCKTDEECGTGRSCSLEGSCASGKRRP